MLLARLSQQSAESRRYDITYEKRLRTGELIASLGVVTVAPVTVPPLVASRFIDTATTSAVLYISGGLDQTTYTLTVQATTDDAVATVRWEDELEVTVKDI